MLSGLIYIRNYSPRYVNYSLREAELNIILQMLNNFNVKQKIGREYLFYYI